MSKDREYDEKMEQKRKSTPFGQAESAAARQLGTAFGQTYKSTTLPRSKASDTSRMNKVYKPKASPGPAINTLNLYGAPKLQTLNKYGSPSPKTKPQSLNLYGAPKLNAKPKPKSNFNYAAPKANKAKPKAKSKNVAGFKPGSIGAKAIGSFKKAYLGK
jgi:hypothetical protein